MSDVNNIISNTLEELYNSTLERCQEVQENLILTGTFNINEIYSQFITLNYDIAEKWQMEQKPPELIINHGEYINKKNLADSESGISFIIEELKRKNEGNRACFSLINMYDIIDSGDEAIPSFLVLQFSFSHYDPKTLLVTAYFRALEVENFLPINLAEICININKICQHFPKIETFKLHLVAFRAQRIKNFSCLTKCTIDVIDSMKIMVLIDDGNRSEIVKLLQEKLNSKESVIITDGIQSLSKGMKLRGFEIISEQIDEIVKAMNEVNTLRKSTSVYNDKLKEKYQEISCNLEKALKLIEEEWN